MHQSWENIFIIIRFYGMDTKINIDYAATVIYERADVLHVC